MRKRDVINMALDILELDPIDSSSTKRTNVGKKASRWYDVAALYVLNYHDWREAITSTTLTTEAGITNIWNDAYEYVYSLPSDALRVLNLELDDRAGWIVEGDYIYTSYYDSVNGIVCRYMKDIREESGTLTQYSDLLGEVVAARLAYNMAPFKKKSEINAVANEIMHEALQVDQMETVNKAGINNPYWTDPDRAWRRRFRRP